MYEFSAINYVWRDTYQILIKTRRNQRLYILEVGPLDGTPVCDMRYNFLFHFNSQLI